MVRNDNQALKTSSSFSGLTGDGWVSSTPLQLSLGRKKNPFVDDSDEEQKEEHPAAQQYLILKGYAVFCCIPTRLV